MAMQPMTVLHDLLDANEHYAETFHWGELQREPRRGYAVVTCMDARIVPTHMLGIDYGDANMLRNAGALVTDDILRSLVVSHHLLGTNQAIVIGHTDCGLSAFTDAEINQRIEAELGTSADMAFHAFTSVDESVVASVERIRSCDLLPGGYDSAGFVYDVRTGRLRQLV